jgi:hypothetical protein
MKPISNKSHQTISSTFQTARGFGGLSAAALMLLSFSSFARAEVRLAALFSDNMVLQQGMPAPVWGWQMTARK